MYQKLSVFYQGHSWNSVSHTPPPTSWMQLKLWTRSENWIGMTRSPSLGVSHSETFLPSQIYLEFGPGSHTSIRSIPGDIPGQGLSINRGAAPLLLWVCPKSPHFSCSDSGLTLGEAIQAAAAVAAWAAFPEWAGRSTLEQRPSLMNQAALGASTSS